MKGVAYFSCPAMHGIFARHRHLAAIFFRFGDHTSDWLVVWLPFFEFSHILGIIIPIDFHIFQRGGPTTNQLTFKLFQ